MINSYENLKKFYAVTIPSRQFTGDETIKSQHCKNTGTCVKCR